VAPLIAASSKKQLAARISALCYSRQLGSPVQIGYGRCDPARRKRPEKEQKASCGQYGPRAISLCIGWDLQGRESVFGSHSGQWTSLARGGVKTK
jgi:hypothetical protein